MANYGDGKSNQLFHGTPEGGFVEWSGSGNPTNPAAQSSESLSVVSGRTRHTAIGDLNGDSLPGKSVTRDNA